MLRHERPTFADDSHRSRDAIDRPAALGGSSPTILIGGGGERRTLRLAARFANESNLSEAPEEIPRKLAALERHCAELGRDRKEIVVSWLGSFVIGTTREQAERKRNAFLAARGLDYATLPDEMRTAVDDAVVCGSEEQVAEFVQCELLERGVQGVVANLPADGHEPEAIERLAKTLDRVLG